MKREQARRLEKIVRSFEGRQVAVFGDIMLDHFVTGKVNRISPEAPVPVVRVTSETYVPGGAGNVAANMTALGAGARLISIVGDDPGADLLLRRLGERGINTDMVVRDAHRPTTEKVRVIAEHQQVVRFDRESLAPLSPSIVEKCVSNLSKALSTCTGVVLSDYGKGMLTNANISKLVSACRKARVPVTVDPKIEHFRRYKGVSCITPNTKEAWEGMRLPPKDGQESIEALGRRIMGALKSETVLITQGPNGMTLFERGCADSMHIPTAAREVFDVTGAGDTVISVLTLALASGASYRDAAVIANHAAGIVVGKLGTATVSADELIGALRNE